MSDPWWYKVYYWWTCRTWWGQLRIARQRLQQLDTHLGTLYRELELSRQFGEARQARTPIRKDFQRKRRR